MAYVRICDICERPMYKNKNIHGEITFYKSGDYAHGKMYDLCDTCAAYVEQYINGMKQVIKTDSTLTYELKKEYLIK